MKKKYANHLAMYQSTATTLAEYQNSWSVLPAFQSLYDEFMNKVTQLETLKNQHAWIAANRGLTKRLRRRELAEKAKKTQLSLRVFAEEFELGQLQSDLMFYPSRFGLASIAEAVSLVEYVISASQTHIGDLAPYGIVQADVDELVALKDAFLNVQSQPRNKEVARKYVTLQIAELVRDTNRLLRFKMDPLVSVLEFEEPEFFFKYTSSRMVIDRPATTSSTTTPLSGTEPGETENPNAA